MKRRMFAMVLAFLLIAVMVSGCGGETKAVSENAKTVIYSMMTAPNADLHDMGAATVIGVEISEEEKAQREALAAQLDANWEKTVGHCFSPNCLDSFLRSPEATNYLAIADFEGTAYEVKSISLVEKTDTMETVSVVLLENDQETTVTVKFHINTDGLFYKVVMPHLYELQPLAE